MAYLVVGGVGVGFLDVISGTLALAADRRMERMQWMVRAYHVLLGCHILGITF